MVVCAIGSWELTQFIVLAYGCVDNSRSLRVGSAVICHAVGEIIGLKVLNTDVNAGCRRCRQQVGEWAMRVGACLVGLVVVMVHVTAASGARQVTEQDVVGQLYQCVRQPPSCR